MKRIYILISIITTSLLIFACGGGGGGASKPISYTGLTIPAVITVDNADVLAAGLFGPETDAFSGVFGVVVDEEQEASRLPVNINLLETVGDFIQQIDYATSGYTPGAIVTNTETMQCESGGTLTITIAVENTTGDFTGTATFNDCVLSGVKLDGPTNISGLIDLNTLEIMHMTMTFTALNEIVDSESYTLNGSITMIYHSTTSSEQIIDYLVRDDRTGTVFQYEDYSIVSTDSVSEILLTISGKFYHPNHGYVDVSTSVTLHVNKLQEWPYMGIVIADGDASSFMIDCEGESLETYTLGVDEDGDGIYETVTIENWQ